MNEKIPSLLEGYKAAVERRTASASPEVRQSLIPSLSVSSTTPAEIDALEARLPCALPLTFRSYLLGPVVEAGIESPAFAIPSNSRLDIAERFLLVSELWPLELIQIGSSPNGDPVCFDLAIDSSDGEFPIVLIDHDKAAPMDWQDSARIREHTAHRWRSFVALLQAACESWEGP